MKSFKEYISEAKDPNRTNSTAWIILHTKNKIILGKRAPGTNNPNLWNFFGGHVDKGESPKEAAIRELFEETKLKIDIQNVKEISTINDAYYFSAKLSDLSKIETTDEISKIVPYKLTDLPNNLHSKTENFFDRLDNLLS